MLGQEVSLFINTWKRLFFILTIFIVFLILIIVILVLKVAQSVLECRILRAQFGNTTAPIKFSRSSYAQEYGRRTLCHIGASCLFLVALLISSGKIRKHPGKWNTTWLSSQRVSLERCNYQQRFCFHILLCKNHFLP